MNNNEIYSEQELMDTAIARGEFIKENMPSEHLTLLFIALSYIARINIDLVDQGAKKAKAKKEKRNVHREVLAETINFVRNSLDFVNSNGINYSQALNNIVLEVLTLHKDKGGNC